VGDVTALGGFLRRVRLLGVPGASAGVPRDVELERRTELEPVFASLDAVSRRAAGVLEDAEREAQAIAAGAAARRRRILADARAAVGAACEQAARARMEEAARGRRQVLAEAARRAEQVEREAAERMPALVELVVRTALGGPAPREPVP
jgi:hypothetical protein